MMSMVVTESLFGILNSRVGIEHQGKYRHNPLEDAEIRG